jgi:hypothetical protein
MLDWTRWIPPSLGYGTRSQEALGVLGGIKSSLQPFVGEPTVGIFAVANFP